MIFQSFDTTRGYREEHNMVTKKVDRALLVKIFYLNGSKSNAALREYRRMEELRRGPKSTNVLKKMVMKFVKTGDFGVAHGRGKLSIPIEVVDDVAVAIADRAECYLHSATSTRAMSLELGAPWSTVRKILRCILHWYPYKIQIVQLLKLHDPQLRLTFALQFLARMEMDDMWPENILWTDVAHFALEVAVNTQNCRIWGSTKPFELHQRSLHSAYVTVWCGFTSTIYSCPVFI